jgi:hypothetical protein
VIAQLDLFGTVAPAPARRPARPDTALLLAMSDDHAPAAKSPPPPVTAAGQWEARTVPADIFARMAKATSCQTICESGKTRPPVNFDGTAWIITGASWGPSGDHVQAYRFEPDDGTAIPYKDWDWSKARADVMGGHHGMAVQVQGQPMRLIGPPRIFTKA